MRGVVVHELREQLFAATERIVARDGAAGVISQVQKIVTTLLGC